MFNFQQSLLTVQKLTITQINNKMSLLRAISLLSALALSKAQFQGETLKFKLAATNLPNCDISSPSDPYVQIFTTTVPGRTHHHDWQRFATTSVKPDTLNPVWDDILMFRHVNGTNQRWRFSIFDNDDNWYNPFDDPLGRIDVKVDDYVLEVRRSKGNGTDALKAIPLFLSEPMGGTLFITPVND